jgi:type I restriction enzyme S subunit
MDGLQKERYKSYKDSGVEWLGEVPAHWEVRRNKSIFFEASQLSKDGSETLLTVSHITGVTPRSEKNVNMFMAESMRGYKVCNVGDLVINTMWAWMGALGTVRHHGICSPAYGVYRPIKKIPYNPRYFDYIFRTPNFITEMTRYSKGIVSSRLRLYPKDFYQIYTVLPSIEEQNKIAHFLDKSVANFDKSIKLLEQRIDKYLDLIKSLVNETVGRGLDSNAPLKPSGIAYLGDIPAHWVVKRLKDVTGINENTLPESTDKDYVFKYIDISNVGSNGIISDPELISFQKSPSRARRIVRKHDVIISTVRTYLRAVAHFDSEPTDTIVSTGFAVLTPKITIAPAYLAYHISSDFFIDQVVRNSAGVSYPAINASLLGSLHIVYPPQQEQADIANFLNKKTTVITAIVTNLHAQIDKLHKLRQTLINDVVTGKIKVIE